MGGGRGYRHEYVEAIGNSGGMLTIWDSNKFKCIQVHKDKHFLVTIGNWQGIEGKLGLVNIYGPNSSVDRKELWSKLVQLVSDDEVKWCLFGDFNEVRTEDERLNSSCNQRGMFEFNRFIEEGGLLDVPLISKRYTRVSDDGFKFSRLDRFLMTPNFGSSWKTLGVRALDRKGSDHSPLLLSEDLSDYGPKPFKFFDVWLKEDTLGAIVNEAWNIDVNSSDPVRMVRDKFKMVKCKIKEWSRDRFGSLDKKIADLREECNRLEAKAELSNWSESERSKWLESRKSWLDLEEKKCSMLRQKAKTKWLTEGDDNTKFLHAAIKNRVRKNTVRGLEINGVWVDDPERVKAHVFDFFKGKFSRIREEQPTFTSVKTRRITEEGAFLLETPFGEEEVWLAICDYGSNKSPGPDGFTIGFVKKFWGILKDDFMKAMRWFWHTESIGPRCNASFLTLIPKVANPCGLSEFRSISLIGIFYKVVAKVLALRFKKVIGKVISDTQSAFIKGRNILDGILIANEVVDYIRNKKKKGLIFKVDFEKAYDLVEWGFLLDSMHRMRIGKKWIGWISACLRSSSMSILVNGSPTKEFTMGKGLRQGDPMAPFLFLIVAENLNLLMEEAKDKGLYEGLSIGELEVKVSHLQYTDDVIFFGNWSTRNLRNLLKILEYFREISGLRINLKKSKIFGVGVQDSVVQQWATGVGCLGETLPFMYLGLPVGASMHKLCSWRPIMEKVRSKLALWKARTISFGGRLTLVKSVLGSTPLYFLSLFRAPSGVIGEIESIRRNFFWGEGVIRALGRVAGGCGFGLGLGSLGVRALGELDALSSKLSGWLPSRSNHDHWDWEFDIGKGFSVKKCRKVLAELGGIGAGEMETVWAPFVPKKVNVFLWRVRYGRIPTRVALDNLGVDLGSVLCPRCGDVTEDIDHALLNCVEVRRMWSRVGSCVNKNLDGIDSLNLFLQEDAELIRSRKGKTARDLQFLLLLFSGFWSTCCRFFDSLPAIMHRMVVVVALFDGPNLLKNVSTIAAKAGTWFGDPYTGDIGSIDSNGQPVNTYIMFPNGFGIVTQFNSKNKAWSAVWLTCIGMESAKTGGDLDWWWLVVVQTTVAGGDSEWWPSTVVQNNGRWRWSSIVVQKGGLSSMVQKNGGRQ
ncbi:hypothetical protein OSB04_005161 [Centaurea solstitialis]|uniref:Reverse transcriptase domain-containing protein n=1 Tax=Centaurea solstitialis TaxID=347529 RepID=A0AA38WRY1_9ASTR|nr:hypothetical protein OSB04_005161 [Centaurea solstitialis]